MGRFLAAAPDLDGLYMPCPQWPVSDVVDRMERDFATPIVAGDPADISAALSAPGRAGEAKREAWPRMGNAALSVRQTAALGPTRESPLGSKNSQNQLANMQPMVCTNRGQYRLSWNIDSWNWLLWCVNQIVGPFRFQKTGSPVWTRTRDWLVNALAVYGRRAQRACP